MKLDLQKIVEYESVIPACSRALADVMPEIQTILRDDLALVCSKEYPSTDINYACLLRQTPEKIEALLDEVVGCFKEKELPTTILVSPACTPADLPQRLVKRGFTKQEPDESWLVMEDLQSAKVPKIASKVTVKQIKKDDAGLFAETMVAAYEMDPEWAPMLAQTIEPSIGQPTIRHFLAFIGEKPVATMTTMRYKEYVVAGSVGVLPEHRRAGIVLEIGVPVLLMMREEGAKIVLVQTTLGPWFERFLRIYGFKQAFKRQGYVLE
jgi:hypothetical protein